MALDDLQLFLAVAEGEGFTAAARRLGLPKSTLSRAVARLEERLGQRLCERSTRHLRLTEAGKLLEEQTRPLVGRLGELLDYAQSRQDTPQGLLRIAAPYEFGVLRLGDVLADVLVRYPGLEAEVDLSSRVPDPRAEDYDIVFRIQSGPLPDSEQVARRIYAVARGLYGSPGLLARYGEPRCLADLAAWPCLPSPDEPVWSLRRGDGEIEELRPSGPLRAQNVGMRLRGVRAGLGAAILASAYCRDALAAKAIVPLLPGYQIPPVRVYALLPGRRLMPAKVRVFLDALAEELAELDAERPAL